MDVIERHDLPVPTATRSLPLHSPKGAVISATTSATGVTAEHELRRAMDRQKRIFDLAMTASQMGTWHYTLGDNICEYDENAQRLYGLTEARFLHDEEGVKSKFHPDDMELMWSRVAAALDPRSDGRYDVEYRVWWNSTPMVPNESQWRSLGQVEISPSENRPRKSSGYFSTS
jgi:PAS domain-containing protein